MNEAKEQTIETNSQTILHYIVYSLTKKLYKKCKITPSQFTIPNLTM